MKAIRYFVASLAILLLLVTTATAAAPAKSTPEPLAAAPAAVGPSQAFVDSAPDSLLDPVWNFFEGTPESGDTANQDFLEDLNFEAMSISDSGYTYTYRDPDTGTKYEVNENHIFMKVDDDQTTPAEGETTPAEPPPTTPADQSAAPPPPEQPKPAETSPPEEKPAEQPRPAESSPSEEPKPAETSPPEEPKPADSGTGGSTPPPNPDPETSSPDTSGLPPNDYWYGSSGIITPPRQVPTITYAPESMPESQPGQAGRPPTTGIDWDCELNPAACQTQQPEEQPADTPEPRRTVAGDYILAAGEGVSAGNTLWNLGIEQGWWFEDDNPFAGLQKSFEDNIGGSPAWPGNWKDSICLKQRDKDHGQDVAYGAGGSVGAYISGDYYPFQSIIDPRAGTSRSASSRIYLLTLKVSPESITSVPLVTLEDIRRQPGSYDYQDLPSDGQIKFYLQVSGSSGTKKIDINGDGVFNDVDNVRLFVDKEPFALEGENAMLIQSELAFDTVCIVFTQDSALSDYFSDQLDGSKLCADITEGALLSMTEYEAEGTDSSGSPSNPAQENRPTPGTPQFV